MRAQGEQHEPRHEAGEEATEGAAWACKHARAMRQSGSIRACKVRKSALEALGVQHQRTRGAA
eukprot:1078175-Pelagomonas_calceolata.AAC.6